MKPPNQLLPASLDPGTGVITLTTCADMTVADVERLLHSLRDIVQQQADSLTKLLLDARRKSFTNLQAQRAFSLGLRAILREATVDKVATVARDVDEAHEALASAEPRLRYFVDVQQAHHWLM